MKYWIAEEFNTDGKRSRIYDGPFTSAQRDYVLKQANKADKWWQKNDKNHVKTFVVEAENDYTDNNRKIIYPENYLKRTGKNSKPRLADKIKLPKIKNSWLVKRSRGKC